MKDLLLLFVGAAVMLLPFAANGDSSIGERRAFQKAKGTYQGIYRGTVGNPIPGSRATFRLKPKAGKRRSKATLDIPVGHTVKFVKLTSVVRNGGDIVKFRGGRVLGKGLLPLGIEIRRGRVRNGTVNLEAGKPKLQAKLFLAGVDLTAGNAPVSGRPVFRGKK